jgi:hypothetical protein
MSNSDVSSASTTGLLSGLAESIRSHVDERLKSPFGGAFAVAWLALNWQSILLLAFSRSPVEARIEVVKAHHVGWDILVWKPVLLAIAITIGFYVFSALMIVVAEFYASVKSAIEKKFDAFRWVSPTAYVELKRKHLENIKFFQELASDNLEKLNAADERANAAKTDAINLQSELAECTEGRARALSEKQALLAESEALRRRYDAVERQLSKLSADRAKYFARIRDISGAFDNLHTPLYQRTNVGTHPDIWNKVLSLRAQLEGAYKDIGEAMRES